MKNVAASLDSTLNSTLNRPVPPGLARKAGEVSNPGNSGHAGTTGNLKATPGQGANSVAGARGVLNAQILKASMEVSIKAGEKSQELVFRAAIDRINELLAPEMGPDAIQGAMSQDNSAEATSARILSLATGFFATYAAQRPNDDADQVAKDFVGLVRGGFEKGFNEAKDILKGLDVFKGDIESGVMKTYDLVQKGFDDFLAGKLKPVDAGQINAN